MLYPYTKHIATKRQIFKSGFHSFFIFSPFLLKSFDFFLCLLYTVFKELH